MAQWAVPVSAGAERCVRRQNDYRSRNLYWITEARRRLYVAGFVGASTSYIFSALAFTGQFDVREWFVFVVVFLAVFFGFEKGMLWAETLESE
ncbi:hypothetical protein ACFQJD_18430 [Haloplanus sp. GCM10025708]|uniref:hypothetical protein n=1 Tax=Haloplanus sp. GCM10025708 TaxID=3252679 RepID=UPI00360A5A18